MLNLIHSIAVICVEVEASRRHTNDRMKCARFLCNNYNQHSLMCMLRQNYGDFVLVSSTMKIRKNEWNRKKWQKETTPWIWLKWTLACMHSKQIARKAWVYFRWNHVRLKSFQFIWLPRYLATHLETVSYDIVWTYLSSSIHLFAYMHCTSYCLFDRNCWYWAEEARENFAS